MLLFFFGGLYRSYHWIQMNKYDFYNEEISVPMKLLAIADLHDYAFDESNVELVEKITAQQPDAILMLGDMLNNDSKDAQTVLDLIEQLEPVAPIYYAMGNHELEWQELHDDNLQQQLESAGAIVLDKSYSDIELNGQNIRIGGLYDYAFYFGDLNDPSNKKLQTYNFLTEFQDTDAFKIMLSHRPDSFIFADASKAWDIDLVVSGHLHGGQVVIPFLGGLYAGDQGWFPEYVHGMYEKDNMNILITSGLSTNKKTLPRWNNPPEIMVLELLPEE